MRRLARIAALGGIFLSADALAWGGDGHRAVGAIADQLIAGSRAQQQVAALLLPGESLEQVANWADCVKGSFCGPQTEEMQAYTAANPKHSEYHYTDVPFQDTQYRDHAVGTADDDIVQMLGQAIAVLRGKGEAGGTPPRFSPRQALLIVTHLAGDIHQPLHVGAAYVGKDGGYALPRAAKQIDAVNMFDARGGNNLLLDDVKLGAAGAQLIPARPAPDAADAAVAAVKPAAAGDKPRQLTRPFHAYWDSTVVDYAMRRVGARTPQQFAQIVIAGKPVVAANGGDAAGWPHQWADDALVVAKQAYADATPGKVAYQTSGKGEVYQVWALSVPDNYPVASSAIAKEQLIKGGYHLAALLQAIWP
ncbi:S1/P1 nuclease [Rugamonas sp. CCM 8940]|uniref:S1/P1 nuclease n=1 Tax=Rugamonas sp. CCM 8940 TaxID=2765359 RepID=UPI0018F44FEC|nr:S1/P1 nuclease [Rugamonas sp. CCM 8940]MBJ7312069.1 S1/P1 nuclease [Rugamonas sp. CCM 8940]